MSRRNKPTQATRKFGVAPGQVWRHGKPFKQYRVLDVSPHAGVMQATVQREIGGALALDEQKLRLPCRRLRDIAKKVR